MQSIRTLLLTLALFIALSGCQSLPAGSAGQRDTEAILQVLDSFQFALRTRNKPLYMSLFFSDKPEHVGWQHVSEDTRLAHIRTTRPDAIKARRIPANNFVSLIDEALSAAEPREEKFSNVKVLSDGDIASVSFDYEFFEGANRTNWGKEMWQLVRTEAGWKIFSVIYSIHDPWSHTPAVSPPAARPATPQGRPVAGNSD